VAVVGGWALGSVRQLPSKTPVYGTLVGLVNVRHAAFGGELVAKVSEQLQRALQERSALDTKLLLRFTAELANARVVPPGDVLALFEQLLASSAEIDDAQQHSDLAFYAYLVLITLPFVALTLQRELPEGLDRLLRTLQRYVQAHKCTVNPLLLVFPEPDSVRSLAVAPLVLVHRSQH